MYSDWKPVNSKTKVLPNDAPVTQFQVRHYINWETTLTDVGIGSSTKYGEFHYQILSPEDSVLFDSNIKIGIFLVSLGEKGLQLFTWFQHAESGEEITTTVIGGEPITADNPAWSHTLGGTPTSEFGTMIPGGGSDYTSYVAYITGFWEGPVYKMNIPVGSKLKVLRDSWGLGASTRPEWQFRFQFGNVRTVDIVSGEFDELAMINPKVGSRTLHASYHWRNGFKRYGYYLEAASEPSIRIADNGWWYLGILQSDGYWEYLSKDCGVSIEKNTYLNTENQEYEPKRIFGSDILMAQLVIVGDTRVYLGAKGLDIYVRRVDKNVGDLQRIGDVKGNMTYSMATTSDGTVIVANSEGMIIYESKDTALTYQQTEESKEEEDDT